MTDIKERAVGSMVWLLLRGTIESVPEWIKEEAFYWLADLEARGTEDDWQKIRTVVESELDTEAYFEGMTTEDFLTQLGEFLTYGSHNPTELRFFCEVQKVTKAFSKGDF